MSLYEKNNTNGQRYLNTKVIIFTVIMDCISTNGVSISIISDIGNKANWAIQSDFVNSKNRLLNVLFCRTKASIPKRNIPFISTFKTIVRRTIPEFIVIKIKLKLLIE